MTLNDLRERLDDQISEIYWGNQDGSESKIICPVAGFGALNSIISGETDDFFDWFRDTEVIHIGICNNGGIYVELDTSGKFYNIITQLLDGNEMPSGFRYVERV